MKYKFLILVIVILGLVFIYNSYSSDEFVEYSDDSANKVDENIKKYVEDDVDDYIIKETNINEGIVRGKTRDMRFNLLVRSLGSQNSGIIMKTHFPDIEVSYVDEKGVDSPYHYFYSKEGNATFVFNRKAMSVAVCEGKVDMEINDKFLETNSCVVKGNYN